MNKSLPKDQVIFVQNLHIMEHFFSTVHHNENLGDEWVPVTVYLPHTVVCRPSIPDGIIKNKDDVIKLHLYDSVEIPNPNPKHQA